MVAARRPNEEGTADEHVATPAPDSTVRLSRRRALTTFAPPALATIAVAGGLTLGSSGVVRVEGEVNGDVDQGGVNGGVRVEANVGL